MKYQLVIRVQEILNNFNTNNILEFLFSIYMCVFTCMHMDTGVTRTRVYTCTRRPQNEIEYLSQLLLTVFSETVSHGPCSSLAQLDGWPENSCFSLLTQHCDHRPQRLQLAFVPGFWKIEPKASHLYCKKFKIRPT